MEIQCDLDPELDQPMSQDPPVQKKVGIDIGVQCSPDEIRRLTKEAEDRAKPCNEIAIQVKNVL